MRITLTVFLFAFAAAPLAAQGGTFVVRLGNDTLAVEKFTRNGNHVEGEMVAHVPRTSLRHYVVDLEPGGAPRRVEVTTLTPDNPAAPAVQRNVATFAGDSVFSEGRRDTTTTTRRFGLPHGANITWAGPYVGWELMAQRTRRAGADSVSYFAYGIGSPGGTPISAWRIGRDSMGFATPWDVYHMRVEQDGRILGSIPQGGTTQFAITRVADADVRAIAARWAAAEAASRPMGLLSVRDTVRASVAGAQLLVDYGRPLKRGRTVFGTVVPWGSVWRTGANAATQFRTDKALEMGGVLVPAGFYTLWTIPTSGGWKLIINGETGQWGTEHKAERDLYQVDMQVSSLTRTVEQFTIGVAPGGQGGTLTLEWDQTRAAIPFTVR